jgi:hypothetical protein
VLQAGEQPGLSVSQRRANLFPLYTPKRTLLSATRMSALCQRRTLRGTLGANQTAYVPNRSDEVVIA